MMNPSAAGATGVVSFPVWVLGVKIDFCLKAESSLLLNHLSSPKLDYSWSQDNVKLIMTKSFKNIVILFFHQ